jgi:GNAT superfamily N-acetyltransferase
MGGKIDLSISQFLAAWRIMCAASPGRGSYSAEGLECVFSGVPIPFFNMAFATGRRISADELQACANVAREWAAARGVPWLFVVTHEALGPGTDCAARLEECGFAPLMPLTGMLAEHVAPPSRIPEGLELGAPEKDAECEALFDVNAAAYGMPLDAGKPVWGRREFWEDHFAVLGVKGGQPVSCAAVMMAEGYRYVALVATSPGQQRRGYADAAMRHALETARQAHGDCPTFLHATGAGRPVYERMGYETAATHTVFLGKEFLEGR